MAEACYDTSSSISPEEETVQVFDFVLEDNIESGNNSYSFVCAMLLFYLSSRQIASNMTRKDLY